MSFFDPTRPIVDLRDQASLVEHNAWAANHTQSLPVPAATPPSPFTSTRVEYQVHVLYEDGTTTRTIPTPRRVVAVDAAVFALTDPRAVSAHLVKLTVTEELESL